MGIYILEGTRINEGNDRSGAVLYSSVTGQAFGRVFDDVVGAEDFIQWFDTQGEPNHYLIEHFETVYEEYLVVRYHRSAPPPKRRRTWWKPGSGPPPRLRLIES